MPPEHQVDAPAADTRLPYVFAVLPRCPSCGSDRLLAYRSESQRDGSKMQYVRCADCGSRCKLVWE